ncbi:MAG: hypothetical protein A2452_13145 [Candidatus Firestonebacteria bacterium RIFOXYC2_FULL_39_67]|nr:MAG: hypothetical protein A2536_03220 [Candidatus Firestonebacteria bacterium RIFOXYD2_FULL_39_29]OGF56265.1 MAG: hypothetical protein A2452_13145 [Candidatus Firestonebacteria bacterium RIFOXYC2_FULL_39_67]
MKICILGNTESVHNRKWCCHLAKMGHEVYLISLHKSVAISGVKVISFYSPLSRFLDIAFYLNKRKIEKLVKKIAPDVLHGQYLSDYGYYASALNYNPFVASGWGSDILIYPDIKRKYFDRIRLVLEKADCVTVEANYLADHLRRRFKVPGKKIAVFPWGIRNDIFNRKSKKREVAALFKKYRIKQGSRVIFSPRSISLIYGIYVILGAIPVVLSKFPKVMFVFARGYSEDNYLNSIKAFIKRDRLEKHIRILDKLVTSKEMAAWFSVSEAFVSAPYSDAISVSVLEGMASGCIPVLTDIAANRELVRDGVNGFIFKQKDPDSLTRKLLKVLTLKKKREEVIKNRNASLIANKYTLKRSLDNLEKVYKKVAGLR